MNPKSSNVNNKISKRACLIRYSILAVIFMISSAYFIHTEYSSTRNFRNSEQQVALKRIVKPKCMGLLFSDDPIYKSLQIVGSAYPNLTQLDDFFQQKNIAPDKVYIFNLKHKPIYYLGDHEIEWYGYRFAKVDELEEFHQKNFWKALFIKAEVKAYEFFHKQKIADLSKDQFAIEQSEIEKRGYHYVQPLKKGWVQDLSFIDPVLSIFETIPKDGWVYFHCARGCARTTTFMILYDIFRNSKLSSLEEILHRQYCLGGEDIANTDVWGKSTWSKEQLEARKRIAVLFYDYMTDSAKGYGHTSFDRWLARASSS